MAARPPVEVVISAREAKELFEPDAPVYPHTGPSLRDDLSDFLEQSVRAEPSTRGVVVVVHLGGAPIGAAEEAAVRDDLHRYFLEESRRLVLARRVNQREGWLSFRYAVPFILVFGAIAYFFYVQSRSETIEVLALLYLIAISVVWVMLWDPIEMLTFDGFLLRFRIRALEKLAGAPVRFEYAPGPVASPSNLAGGGDGASPVRPSGGPTGAGGGAARSFPHLQVGRA